MTPKIEKNIPLPTRHQRGRKLSPLTVTLLEMRSGDSIFLAEPDRTARLKLYNRVYKLAKRQDISITAQFDETGLRVWRK